MHACHAATTDRHIIASRSHNCHDNHTYSAARDARGHHAPPETEPNWLLSLPTDLVISEQEERSEGGRERNGRRSGLTAECGERERERDILFTFIKVCSTWLPTCPPPPARPRTEELAPAERTEPRHSRRGGGGAVRPPSASVRPSAGPVVSIWPISNMVRKQARPMSSDRMRR